MSKETPIYMDEYSLGPLIYSKTLQYALEIWKALKHMEGSKKNPSYI
jgi:hypothetical protein